MAKKIDMDKRQNYLIKEYFDKICYRLNFFKMDYNEWKKYYKEFKSVASTKKITLNLFSVALSLRSATVITTLVEESLDYNKKIETLDNFINCIRQLNAKSMPFDYKNLLEIENEINSIKIKI